MSNPIIDVNEQRANDPSKLPLLQEADPTEAARPLEIPPQKDAKPERGKKKEVEDPISNPAPPTAPPQIQPEPQVPPAKLFDPTVVDRGINEQGAVGQGFGGQQGLTRIAAPDVLRNQEAQQQFRQNLDQQIEDTEQADVQPYLFDPPQIRDTLGNNAATYNAIYNNAIRGDAAMAAADAARILPQYTPQRTKPVDSAFDWMGAIVGQRNEGPRKYVNMTGSLLGPLIYGFGLAQNTVVGAALDVRTQLSRAVTAFVPPWMRANAVGYLQRLESSPNTPLAQNIIGGLKSVAGVNSNADRLNDGRSNVIEALRGAQFAFGDKSKDGGVGIDQDKGFRVGPAKGKTIKVGPIELTDGFDVNPGLVAGVALDVLLGGRVDRALGKAVRAVVPKKAATAVATGMTAAEKRAAIINANKPVPKAKVPPVEYDQPGLPFVPQVRAKAPVKPTPEQAKKARQAAAKIERVNKKQLKRNAEIKLAEMQRAQGDEQLVLPIPQVMKEYERQLPKYAVKLTPKQSSAQLRLPLDVESKVPVPPKPPAVSPALKKELARRLSVPPKKVDQLMLRLPDNLQERIRQAEERIAEFTKGMPEALPPRKGEAVRQGELPLGDVSKRSRPPKQLPGSAKAARAEERRIAQAVAAMPEVKQIELDYTNWLKDGEESAQGVLDLGNVGDDLSRFEDAVGTGGERAPAALDRFEAAFDDQPIDFTLPIDWNTRFPEVFEAPLVPPLKAEYIDPTKRTRLVEEVDFSRDVVINAEPDIRLGGTPERAQLPSTSSGRPSYTDYRMNLVKRDQQQLQLPLDVPRVRIPRESTAKKYTPTGPAQGRQGVLFTAVDGPDGLEYRATKAVRDAVEPPTPRPPKSAEQLQGAQDAVEAARLTLDDTEEAARISRLAEVRPDEDVVRELDHTLAEMPEIVGGSPEVQAVAELANATRRAEVTNLVVGNAVRKLADAKAALDNTPDIGRRFTNETANVPRAPYVRVALPPTGAKGTFYHGSRVADLDLSKADPLLGGARHELGIGHYLTSDPKVARAAALANVSENLPLGVERTWAEPKVYTVDLIQEGKTVDATLASDGITSLARQVGRAFPEFAEQLGDRPLALTDIYDLAAQTMSEARQLAFQRHMAAAMLEMDYRRVRAGRTVVVLDPATVKVGGVEVLEDSVNPSADMGQRVVLEQDAVAQTNSLVAKANVADAEVRHAAQVVEDVKPIMEQVEAEVAEKVDSLKLLDDQPLPSRSERIRQILRPTGKTADISPERQAAFDAYADLMNKAKWDEYDLGTAEQLTSTLKANGDFNEAIGLRSAINRKRTTFSDFESEVIPEQPLQSTSIMRDIMADAPARTSIIDTVTITPTRTNFPPQQVEDLAKEIARTGRVEKLPVVRGNIMDDYVIVSGDLEYLAYERARQLNPKLPDRMTVYVDDTIKHNPCDLY